MGDAVKDALIETLAILLYMNDGDDNPQWMKLHPDDREIYRRVARGEEPLDD